MQYAIDVVLVGHDGDKEINAEMRVHDAAVSIRAFGSKTTRTLHAQKPTAIAFVDTLAAELVGGAIVPHLHRKLPESVICPDCLGTEPEL